MPGVFIHLDDPGFPDEPWPGQRRLGPFNTPEEALAQAVHDAAMGQGVASGIYPEEHSEALRRPKDALAFDLGQAQESLKQHIAEGESGELIEATRSRIAEGEAALKALRSVKATYTGSVIRKKGEAEARRIMKLRARAVQEQADRDSDLDAFLRANANVAAIDLREHGFVR